MPRYDKYDPIANGFRAALAADFPDANLGKLYGVGLDNTGKLVIGAGHTGILGVLVCTEKPGVLGPLKQVSRIDVMTHGCVVGFCATAGVPGTDVGVAGSPYFSDTSGNISLTPADGAVLVGFTVEPDRLEVNVVPTALVKGQFGLSA